MTVALSRDRAGGPADLLRRYAPPVTMFFAAPVIAVTLLGATPVTAPWAFAVHLPLYGAGVLLIRELVRHRGLGWFSILLMGAAFGIVHEGAILQTIWNPHEFTAKMGRAFGVNYVWAGYITVYHMFWSVTLPVLIVELLYPKRRAEPWLPSWAVAGVAAIYLVGCALEFRFISTSSLRAAGPLSAGYQWPVYGLLAVAAVVPLLVWLALRKRPAKPAAPATLRPAPSAWSLLPFGFTAGLVWFGLLGMAQFQVLPAPLAIVLGALVLVGVLSIMRRWTGPDREWTDLHWLSLCIGRLLVDGLYGIWAQVALRRPIDLVVQIGFFVTLVVLLTVWWRHVRRRLRDQRSAGRPVATPAQAWQRAPVRGPEPG
jgi:hypothetical protein